MLTDYRFVQTVLCGKEKERYGVNSRNTMIGKTIVYAKTYELASEYGDIDVYSFISTSDGMIYMIMFLGDDARCFR
jgi:hypothetical protein